MNSNVKRKFNALLQGLGNRSSTSLGTVATVDAPDDPTAAARFASDYDHGNGNASPRAMDPSTPATAMAPDSTPPGNPFPSTATTTITTPTTITSATAATPKKRRVGAPTSTPLRSSFGRPGVMVTTTTNVIFTKNTPAPAGSASPTPATAHVPPRYCPGDRDQLIRRLATFQDLTEWTPKPERVSEVEWARRGWELSGRERVRCALCGKELVVKLNRKDVGGGREVPVLIASDIEDAVVERYAELVVASHGDQCLWRKKGCDAFLLRLPLASPKLALEGLRERYHQLCERKSFLPYDFNLRLPEHFNIDTIVKSLPHDFFSNPPSPSGTAPEASSPDSHPAHPPEPSHVPPPPPINRVALALALFGWQGLTNPRTNLAVPNSAGCHTCLRRLGLWMFRSREVDPDTNRILVSAPMDHLDPVLEHRFFCPWKSGVAQRSHSGVAGAGAGATSRRFLLASSPTRETSGTVGTVGGDAAGGEPGNFTGALHGQDMPGWEILVQVLKNEAFVRERVVAVAKKKLFLHGCSKSAAVPGTTRGNGAAVATDPTSPGAAPVTAGRERRRTMANGSKPANSHHVEGLEQEGGGGEGETEEAREEKQKAMMSRLRRVKSLFNVKGGSGRLRRMTGASSRPGTGHSSRSALGGS